MKLIVPKVKMSKILIGYLILIFPLLNAIFISPSDGYYSSPFSFFSRSNSSIFLGEDTLRYFSAAADLGELSFSNNILVETLGFLANYTGLNWWLISVFNTACLFYAYSLLLRAFPWFSVKRFLLCIVFVTPLLIFSTASLNKEILLVSGLVILLAGLRIKSRLNIFIGLALLICRPTDFLFGVYLLLVFGNFRKTVKAINTIIIVSLFLPLNLIFTDEIRASFFFQSFTALDQAASTYYNFVFSFASLPGSVALLIFVNFGINLLSPLVSDTIRASFSTEQPLIEGIALFLTSMGSIIYLSKLAWSANKSLIFIIFVWIFIHAIYPLNQFRYYIVIFPVIPLMSVMLFQYRLDVGSDVVNKRAKNAFQFLKVKKWA